MAADHALRTFGLPGSDLWDVLLGRRAVLEFHEDNETCIGTIKSGYSPAMCHIKRTHGVCLRWLAERFTESFCNLYYKHSELQVADIYTKAFSVPAEWDRVLRLVNVLDPRRFWDRVQPSNLQCCMPSSHKGGVEFEYCTSNPWHGRGPRNLPRRPAETALAAAPARRSSDYSDRHIPWVTPPGSGVTPAAGGVVATPADRDHDLAEYFKESPNFDDEDYASTADPGSDREYDEDSNDAEDDDDDVDTDRGYARRMELGKIRGRAKRGRRV